jgi:nicotinamidase-related amidase
MWVCVALGVLVAVCAAPAHGADEATPGLRPVLLVVDVQNIWLPLMSEEDRASAPDKINEIIALFREFDYPVIRVYHSDPERGPEVDTEPFEFLASIAINDDDLRIVKAEPSSFTRTELENVLRERDRNAVFLCGLSATGCVLATYYGALDRDFMVLMVEDALLSPNASYTDVIEDISYLMTIEEIRETFEQKDK